MSVEIFYSSISIENIRTGKKKTRNQNTEKVSFFLVFFITIFYLRNYVKEACAKVLKRYQPRHTK
jgi:hypothetical protein